MSKKYIFLDVDGTLMDCSESEYIPESAYRAIAMAQQNSHKVFVCTGRTTAEITPPIKKGGFDGYICSAGAEITIGDKMIFQHAISPAELDRLKQIAAENGFGMIWQCREHSYVDKAGEGFFEAIQGDRYLDSEFGKISFSYFTPLAEYDAAVETVSKVMFLTGDYDLLEQIGCELADDYRMAIHGSRKTKVLMGDMSTKGVIKSTGIQKVVDYLDEGDVATYSYGDSNNDIDMLEYCTHGTAMGNALDNVKAIADEICEPLLEDGLYKSFKRNGLI